MSRFRNILSLIAFVLLMGFTAATIEESFGCADDPEAVSCTEDCCLACLTLSNMNAGPQVLHAVTPILPPYPDFNFAVFSIHSDPFLSGLDRPPISSLS